MVKFKNPTGSDGSDASHENLGRMGQIAYLKTRKSAMGSLTQRDGIEVPASDVIQAFHPAHGVHWLGFGQSHML